MNNGMQEAVSYFESMGIPMKDGLLDVNALTEEKVERIKKWQRDTEQHGIMMTNMEDFYRSLLVAISVHPQKDSNGNINYLFGKGFGTEVALRGNVLGRTKHNTNPIYRSHSDFELYDAKVFMTRLFLEIFGTQEYFPPDRTKGLVNFEEGYMDSTYETVDVDGYKVLVPQLELLFADKFLRKEGTPRNGVYDCELLANEYDLNFDLIKEHVKEHGYETVKRPLQLAENRDRYKKCFERKILNQINSDLKELGNLQLSLKELNESFGILKEIKNGVAYGIKADMFIPLTESDVITSENMATALTEDYKTRTEDFVDKKTQEYIEELKMGPLTELDELIERVNASKEIDNKEQEEKKDYGEI